MEEIPVCVIRTQPSVNLEVQAYLLVEKVAGGHLWGRCAWWDQGQGRLVPFMEEVSESRDWQGGQLLMGLQSRVAWNQACWQRLLMRVTIMKMKRREILWNRGKQTFCKGKDNKYFRLCWPHSICCNYLLPPLQHKKRAIDNLQTCARPF